MNIYDISKKAGVSIATVSRVMNGSTNVSEKTRKKILDVIAENDYTPNAFARGLGLNTMKTIGFLCADSSDQFFFRAVYHLERALRANHYDAILSCTGMDLETRREYLKMLLAKKVDAVILVGSSFIEEVYERNQYIFDAAAEVPVIILNGYLDAPNVYCVLCDDTEIVEHTASVFLDSGRRDLLFLYRADSYSGKKKLTGFKNAFSSRDIPLDPQRILLFQGSIAETKQRLLSLADSGLRFDTVIAGDDELAIGALKYAKERRLEVPSEFSVVGYNNSSLGVCCEPELTTIDNQLEFCCNHAVTVLMSVLDGKTAPGKTLLSARILQRGTTDVF
ncbi:MAG: LacI family DNA-binding transcriptional regulator [Eubacteriales bacterium]|nr:LacI family DNA-binding transcriptional regulator [Eubacteriales bacterium]